MFIHTPVDLSSVTTTHPHNAAATAHDQWLCWWSATCCYNKEPFLQQTGQLCKLCLLADLCSEGTNVLMVHDPCTLGCLLMMRAMGILLRVLYPCEHLNHHTISLMSLGLRCFTPTVRVL